MTLKRAWTPFLPRLLRPGCDTVQLREPDKWEAIILYNVSGYI